MNKTNKLRNLILNNYVSINEFAKIAGIPTTTLVSALNKNIGGMAVDRVIKICEILNIDIKTFDPLTTKEEIKIYSTDEECLLRNFNQFNSYGRKKIIAYTNDLLGNPEFKNSNVESRTIDIWEQEGKSHLMPIAAHDRLGEFEDTDYKHDTDIMINDELWK